MNYGMVFTTKRDQRHSQKKKKKERDQTECTCTLKLDFSIHMQFVRKECLYTRNSNLLHVNVTKAQLSHL